MLCKSFAVMGGNKIPKYQMHCLAHCWHCIAFGRVKKLSVLASGRHMRLLVPTISPAAPSTFLPQNCKPGNFHQDHKTYIFIGKTCMKELQACFRRDDVVRTTTNHLESMKTFLIGIAGDKVAPDALNSCDAAADIDFGPEEEEEDVEDDYDYMEYEDESEEVSRVAQEEIKAVIQKTLSEEKREQQQDEPKKPPPPKKLLVKSSANWSEKNTGSFVLLLAVITFRQLTG